MTRLLRSIIIRPRGLWREKLCGYALRTACAKFEARSREGFRSRMFGCL